MSTFGDMLTIKRKLFLGALALVIITLPFTKHFNSLTIGLLAAAWVFYGNWREKFLHLKKHRWIWIFIAYYAMHVLGLVYTDNISRGGFVLEKKSGMWVLPVLLASIPLHRKELNMLLKLFVASCAAGLTICLSKGLYYLFAGQSDAFLYHHGLSRTIGIHAVYFSVYLALCILIVFTWLPSSLKIKKGREAWFLLLIIYLLIGIFLLASKTIMAILFILGSAVVVRFVIKQGNYRILWAYLTALVLAGVLISQLPKTRERFVQLFNTQMNVVKMESYKYDTPLTGLSIRMVIWKYSFRLIGEEGNWITGVGPGDSQDLLDQTYTRVGIYVGNPTFGDHGYLGYNAHNQFIQSLLDLGAIGLILLLMLFGIPLRLAIRSGDMLLTGLVLVFVGFCVTESALEAHHGSVFFTLFVVLMLALPKEEIPQVGRNE